MKINWGTGIIIAFALFISFIMYFVISVQTNSKYDNELVVEEYYKKDTRYNEEMGKLKNAAQLIKKPLISTDAQGLKIVFPADFEPKKMTGKISLYRPSNKKMDFEIAISQLNSNLFIPKIKLAEGFWDITIEWNYNKKDYLIKDKIYLD